MLRYSLLIGLLLCSTIELNAQSSDNSAIVTVLRRTDKSIDDVRVWRRVRLNNQLDLVIAVGTPRRWEFDTALGDSTWLGLERRLGLFLQDRARPGLVFSLAIAPGVEDCAARIVRATTSDTVITCSGERSETYPNQKFVYDIRAKRLIRRYAYGRFEQYRVIEKRANGVVISAANDQFDAVLDFSTARTPGFRMVKQERRSFLETAGASNDPPDQFVGAVFGPSDAFRLVKIDDDSQDATDCADPEVIVSEQIANGTREYRIPRQDPECHRIGPWQIDGNTLWFGTTFYAGEGGTGIGGLGFFDPLRRQFSIVSSPEISNYSVSAINVQPDSVWLALESRGEYGNTGEGVLRYDRTTRSFERFNIGANIGREFVVLGSHVLLITNFGIVVIERTTVREFFVDQTTEGLLRVVEGLK
jgi:hypothetical protein